MDAVTSLIEGIKARWDAETMTYTDYDTVKILELMHERMIEMDTDLQHHNHNGGSREKTVHEHHLEIEITRLENEIKRLDIYPLKQQQVIKELTKRKNELLLENTRLREQLRWHPVSELPPVDERYKDRKVSVFVLIKTWGTMIKLGYYDFEEGGWKYAKGEIVLITEMLRWMYIPEDKDGE